MVRSIGGAAAEVDATEEWEFCGRKNIHAHANNSSTGKPRIRCETRGLCMVLVAIGWSTWKMCDSRLNLFHPQAQKHLGVFFRQMSGVDLPGERLVFMAMNVRQAEQFITKGGDRNHIS